MFETFIPFAQPWWVNLLLLIPLASIILGRFKPIELDGGKLAILALFGTAFGFVEAVVVVYLRAASGMADGFEATPMDITNELSQRLLRIELLREIATMIMLLTVAYISSKYVSDKVQAFLWIFAFWDIYYYIGLKSTINWPQSLTSPDVLFLIPTPWYSQVWFPILISSLTIICIIVTKVLSERRKALE